MLSHRILNHWATWATFGLIAFVPFLGAAPLFDWDEINFAESAREMILTGDYFRVQVNYMPFWEKPPLFFWMQVVCMRIFGINEFAARLPNALIGITTLMVLFRHGRTRLGDSNGWWLPALYACSLLPFMYFKSSIIDPTFNLFTYLGLWEFSLAHEQGGKQNIKQGVLAGVWIGAATLTKGPVSLLLFGLSALISLVWLFRTQLRWSFWISGLITYACIVMTWFGAETLFHGPWFLEKFIAYQIELFTQPVAGHEQPWFYHPLVFTVGCLPVSLLLWYSMFRKFPNDNLSNWNRVMLVWFWCVMVIFSISKTKIIHYSSMTWLPAAWVASILLSRMEGQSARLPVWLRAGWILGILVLGLAVLLINQAIIRLPVLAETQKNVYIKSLILAQPGWSGWEWLTGCIPLISVILLALTFFKRYHLPKSLVIQLVTLAVFLNMVNVLILPKIAGYTQGAPIEFYSALRGKSVYVLPANYKSYLPYFYAQVLPPGLQTGLPVDSAYWADKEWLIHGKTDRPVFMSARIDRLNEEFRALYTNFDSLYTKDGFAFYVRYPDSAISRQQ